MHSTRFPELNELLALFVVRVSSVLGDDLTGIYLTGSFALGGGDAASDCDFLVVKDGTLSGHEERALRELHEEIPNWSGYWASNFEGSYAPRADLETLAALGRPWLYVDRGKREMAWSPHCNVEDVRWVLLNRPLVLAGTDPREFCCKVPAPVLQAAMRPQLENLLDDVRSWAPFDISWTQRYLVETACRMLHTLEHGEVIAKPSALDWAAETLPAEWRGLLGQVRRDRSVQWDAPPPPGSMERAVAFVEYVQARELSSPS
ncbi:MAG TPA: aminoglycoside adenylyltransferase domain-containing protein [Gaiellaceae bacterium]|nr:aminoglycoside adenylyltransferase domain-containing protein [Gaiellaceae bacterium]